MSKKYIQEFHNDVNDYRPVRPENVEYKSLLVARSNVYIN